MKNRVITISREFGSGGRTIGKKAAEKLNIPCYDSQLIQKIAAESGFHEDYIKEAGEYAPGGFLSSALSHRGIAITNEDYIWEIQCRVITDLAEKGPCVIVGRCADYVLRERKDLLSVFIHAPLSFRAQRAQKVYEKQAGNIEDFVRKKDKKRAAFYNYFSQNKWGDSRHYHLAISSVYGVDFAVEVLKHAAETFPDVAVK